MAACISYQICVRVFIFHRYTDCADNTDKGAPKFSSKDYLRKIWGRGELYGAREILTLVKIESAKKSSTTWRLWYGNSLNFSKYMKGYVYILEDDEHRYYIGSSLNPDQRYQRHLTGFVYTTHRMKNPRLIFTQEFTSIQEAKKIELKLKKLKRKDYIEKIIKDGYIKMK